MNLDQGNWGGRRSGSGRKRKHSEGVAHRTREKVISRHPLHINFKFRTNIRNKDCLRLLKRAIINSRRHGLRIIHFSLQSNHIHLIVESENNQILTRGMRSLTVTFAKGLNKGRIQMERYHLHVLRSIRESRNAMIYVLFNKQKHERGTYSKIDEFSSILSLKNALNLIKDFAVTKKVTLQITKSDSFDMDESRSYLLKMCLADSLASMPPSAYRSS